MRMIPPLANRFVAGKTRAEAIEQANRLNDQGINAIINLLGEHHEDRRLTHEDTTTYLDLVGDIADGALRACITVKPTQLGLMIDEELFRENLRRIVERADNNNGFVWIDMEHSSATDATIRAYEDFEREFGSCVGICLQANLQRTDEDITRLASTTGKVRLVKGAYKEPRDIAFTSPQEVNDAFREGLELMFRTYDGGIAVASHDPVMIEHAIRLHQEYDTPFEIQMLMGVMEDVQAELAEEYDVWQYVPYGGRWLAYLSRRLLERKENIFFALRAIVGR